MSQMMRAVFFASQATLRSTTADLSAPAAFARDRRLSCRAPSAALAVEVNGEVASNAPSITLVGQVIADFDGATFASRPQQRDDRSPFALVVARSLGGRVRAGSAPKLRIEGGLGGAEFHVPVSPKGINAVWILATGMGHGAPGVNQVGDHRPLRA